MKKFQRLCLFCGSRDGVRPEYVSRATTLGSELARRGIGLVYGGAGTGLMTHCADAVLRGGGEVVGVMPRSLVERESAHRGLTDLRIVDSMHERKALMHYLSDGFAVLPGGSGTLDEFFEVFTWAQLGLHSKPIGLLNVEGFFDGLVGWLEHTKREGFLGEDYRKFFFVEGSVDALLTRMLIAPAPTSERWPSSRP